MAQSAAADLKEELHKKLAYYVESKKYVDEPELLPWYKKELGELKPRTRELLENYSKITPADVEPHVHRVRDEAFKVFPYPCVGNWGFLRLNVADSPVYQEVVERVKNGELYLDIGCCMGQDIRKLVSDGVPAENTFASDLKKEFWDIGHNLFLDKTTLKTKFIQADVFDPDSDLKQLDNQLSIVLAHSFFHLFDWDDQVKAAKRVTQLLKAEPGVMIFGRQGAMVDAGSFSHVDKNQSVYWHNVESWKKLWKQVGDETGTEWNVEAFLGEEDLAKRLNASFSPPGSRFMTFIIRRL